MFQEHTNALEGERKITDSQLKDLQVKTVSSTSSKEM
jgi:hypothetical protein